MNWIWKARDLQTLLWLTVVLCLALLAHLLQLGGLSGGLRECHSKARPLLDSRIDLNAGAWIEYVMVPGIGEKTARAIVGWRERHGAFDSIDQLDQVPGIGPVTREKARPYLFVSHPDPTPKMP